jgi:hypothetical protein
MLKKIIFIILLTNMANNNIDKPINYQDEDSATQDNLNIDWDFIKLREGNKNFGHQPTANSGITIGMGFDLKEKTESSLKDMGFNDDLIDELKPYLGLTGDEAALKIKEDNLVLGADDISNINRLSKKHYTNDIVSQYESTGKKFNKLSPEQQTIVMSVGYQYGNLKTRTPNFWKGVINDDWTGVVNELHNFGDEHDTRREIEAKYLFDSLDELRRKKNRAPLENE